MTSLEFTATEEDKKRALRGEPWALTNKRILSPSYEEFIEDRSRQCIMHGFDPTWLPEFLFGFQRDLVEWATQKGRAGIFADCGLGKTVMQLVWARNVIEQTQKPVLLLTPIAVGQQTEKEAKKFGLFALRSTTGAVVEDTTITNYEKLHLFDSSKWGGLICDESSILKDAKAKTREAVTRFAKAIPYRLLCTATAAPNDYHELGTSSECLGDLGFRDMITKFFAQETKKDRLGWGRTKYRFKEHAKVHFWRWVCSWARACRRPSDLGYDDSGFVLPKLHVREHVVNASRKADGYLFALPAKDFREERQERRQTIDERCDWVKSHVDHGEPVVCWGHLNDECNRLEKIIPDAVQVSGRDSDEEKERKLTEFADGQIRVLVTKPKIGAWGLNWQHCNRVVMFPSHSYEQYYQAVRRCWRFGQKREVFVDIVSTEGEQKIMKNLQRKSDQADEMFTQLVAEMNRSMACDSSETFDKQEEIPSWL